MVYYLLMSIEKRAVTDEMKREVVEQLYLAWVANPEQRLGQLIVNVSEFFFLPNIFNVEDLELAKGLDAYLKK